MLKAAGIYKITNIVNGKYYVGSALSIKQRWYTHKSELRRGVHGNSLLQRSWNKYGEDAFTFEVLEEVSTADELLGREQHYIDELKAYDRSIGFNLRRNASSNLGHEFSEVTRRRMSEAHSGTKNSFYGREHNETTKRRIGDATRGSKKWCAKLDEEKVADIRRRIKEESATQAELCREYGVSDSVMSRVCNGKTWKHVAV